MSQYIVGVTGGIGSGKSALTSELEKLGTTVIDADLVAREVVEPGKPALKQIASHFGPSILLENSELNRAKLRELVFQDKAEKYWLEKLLHPLIRTRTIELLENAESSYAVLASPLLLETDQHNLVDAIVVVDTPESLQLVRASKRDSNSEEQIKRIMKSQMDRKQRLAKADLVVDNSGSIADLIDQAHSLHQTLCERADLKQQSKL